MNLPRVKTLMRIEGMDKDRAKLLRKILEFPSRGALLDWMDENSPAFAATRSWVRQCYNVPGLSELKMSMANDIIEGCGVEYAGEVDMRDGPPLEYVNLSDTYDCTLCRFQGRYLVSSWGDIVERHGRLFRDR